MDQAMSQALDAEKQQAGEERTRLQSEITSLNQLLEENRAESERQLDEAWHQAQTDIRSLHERMDQAMAQALEAEKQHAGEEQARLQSEIDTLNQQLEMNRANSDRQLDEVRQQAQADSEALQDQLKAIHVELCKQQDKRAEQKTLLEQERNTSNELRELVKRTENALNESEKRFTDAKHTYQKTLSELQHKLESNKDARAKLTQSEAEAQKAMQDLSSLRAEMEQKITNLHAQLEHQQKSSEETIRSHEEKNAKLQQTLSEIQEREKRADSTIRLLKKDRESDSGSKVQLEDQLARLKMESQAKQADLVASVESERQEKESLRQQLELVNTLDGDSNALARAKEENMLLKRKIKGMREVQLNMESQLIVDGSEETRKLHDELRATQAKLKNATKLANQSKDLLRENQIHESAINILSEDLDELAEANKSLMQERDELIKELSKIKGLHSKQAHDNYLTH
jgi:hypothetical protein